MASGKGTPIYTSTTLQRELDAFECVSWMKLYQLLILIVFKPYDPTIQLIRR